jgi:hypothetical protein
MKKLSIVIAFCSLAFIATAQAKPAPKKNDTVNTDAGSVVIKTDSTTYVLFGRTPDFQLLYKAIVFPGDVTPNQSRALAEWIAKAPMLSTAVSDTTKKK